MKQDIYTGTICYTDLKEMIFAVADSFKDSSVFKYNRDGMKIEISFKRFKNDIDNFGTYLFDKGYCGGKKIALVGENSYEWIVSYFAAVNGENVIVPVDKELKSNEIHALLKSCEADLLIYSNQKKKAVDEMLDNGLDCELLCTDKIGACCDIGDKLCKEGMSDYCNCGIDPNAMCAIIYTSGTTGDPKGVMLSHRNLVMDAYLSISCMKIPRNGMAILPLNHTFGFMACILCQIWMGYTTFINDSLKTVMRDIREAKPGHISVVPLFIENMYKNIWKTAEKEGKAQALKKLIKASNAMRKVGIDARRRLFKPILDKLGGNLEMIISGGAPIDDKYMKGFDDLGITIINGYGITECSPIVALNRVDDVKFGTVGNAIPDVRIRIYEPDENGEGEIWVNGDIVMLGYYKNPEATEEVLKDGWFNTGDIGKIVDGKYLAITGRKKNLIILANGKNVYPEELEYLISHVENVTEVLVYEENEMITAEIYSDSEEDKDAVHTQIKNGIQELNRSLADYKKIRKVKFRSVEFEKTTTKKIKRNYSK